MKIDKYDINDFSSKANPALVNEIEITLNALPLYVKKSDQAGHTNHLVFSPVATNSFLEKKLHRLGWGKIPVPENYRAFGIDIDFGKNNLLVEAQFSNYPFFTNNVVRSNILYNANAILPPIGEIEAVIIITKAKLFEAANSTLYFEQAVEQTKLMMQHSPIQIPLRIIGLTANRGITQRARIVTFHRDRYSRTVVKEKAAKCKIGAKGEFRERESITII